MTSKEKIKITVQATVNAPLEEVWKKWTNPTDIIKWNHASEDWHTTKSENDLRAGGKFLSRMEAKDGSMGFDYWGIYDIVRINELIEFTLEDGRKVKIAFEKDLEKTIITETFEAENENSVELQKSGWQSILDNFRKYAETD